MNNDIRKLIDDNWEDIKEFIVKKAEAEQKPKTIWDLKVEKGEECYCLQATGTIIQYPFDRSYEDMITDARDLGNAFLTWKEAKFECERRKIEVILRKYSRPLQKFPGVASKLWKVKAKQQKTRLRHSHRQSLLQLMMMTCHSRRRYEN